MANGTASRPPTWLGAFALGTFHALLLVWLFVFIGFRGGGLGGALSDIGTAAGLAVFALIWAVVGVITYAAIVRLPRGTSSGFVDFVREGMWTAGVGGALLVVTVAAVGALVSPFLVDGGFDERAQALGVTLFFGLVGGTVAFLVGALLGGALTLIDTALLAVSRWIAPDLPAPSVEGDAASEDLSAREAIDA
ncbi:MAG: hypothetical protein GEU80_14375 [Dehalococcoidia bacterium]|nr:hypothetical protein [Dehalococcoidia bacterium]